MVRGIGCTDRAICGEETTGREISVRRADEDGRVAGLDKDAILCSGAGGARAVWAGEEIWAGDETALAGTRPCSSGRRAKVGAIGLAAEGAGLSRKNRFFLRLLIQHRGHNRPKRTLVVQGPRSQPANSAEQASTSYRPVAQQS